MNLQMKMHKKYQLRAKGMVRGGGSNLSVQRKLTFASRTANTYFRKDHHQVDTLTRVPSNQNPRMGTPCKQMRLFRYTSYFLPSNEKEGGSGPRSGRTAEQSRSGHSTFPRGPLCPASGDASAVQPGQRDRSARLLRRGSVPSWSPRGCRLPSAPRICRPCLLSPSGAARPRDGATR